MDCPHAFTTPVYAHHTESHGAARRVRVERVGRLCGDCWTIVLDVLPDDAVPLRAWAEGRGVSYARARYWHAVGKLPSYYVGGRVHLPAATPVPGRRVR